MAHEVIHSLKTTKKPDMLLKLDLSKTFDRLRWEYIENILLTFGFNSETTNQQNFRKLLQG
jgi:hypothetical protein